MWQRNLAISDILWGDLLRLDDDVARSESHYRAALARLEPLIARDPSRALWKRDAVTAHNELAWLALARGSLDSSRREIAFWKEAGVTHVTAHTTYVSGHHKRIAGHSAADHLAAITRYRAAVADLL